MRLVIIGCGAAGSAIAQDAALLGYSITGCVDTNRERAASFAKRYDAAVLTPASLNKFANCDAIAVATPTHTHAAFIHSAVGAKRSVLVTRPLCASASEAEALAKDVQASGLPFALAAAESEAAPIRAIEAAYRAGKADAAGFVRAVRRSPAPTGVKNWYRDLDAGGGAIANAMQTDFAWIADLLGLPNRVFAQLVRKTGANYLEYAMATLTFPSGAIAQLVASWSGANEPRTTIEICGDKGMIQYDSVDHAFEFRPFSAVADPPPHPPGAFTRSLRSLAAPPSYDELIGAVRAAAIADAALRSAATGRAVTLGGAPGNSRRSARGGAAR